MKMADICRAVADYYDIKPFALRGRRKTKDVSHARQMAMFLCLDLTDQSASAIARHFDRDHTTVLHARRAVLKRAGSEDVQRQLTDLRTRLTHYRPPPGQEGYLVRQSWPESYRHEGAAMREIWS